MLSANQQLFTFNVHRLIQFAYSGNFTFTFGEAYRTVEQEDIYVRTGKSKTYDSLHLQRLAIDLNIFHDGRLLFSDKNEEGNDLQLIQPVVEYWLSLNSNNRWGGNFKNLFDPNHFEMRN